MMRNHFFPTMPQLHWSSWQRAIAALKSRVARQVPSTSRLGTYRGIVG
ncbi:hypothetical protein RRSWK_02128 [Rhodopirellula sp. SWK7]|nr:hypothetical protein RRSWK_02128 [Rhodopirellula sp. SWK7]